VSWCLQKQRILVLGLGDGFKIKKSLNVEFGGSKIMKPAFYYTNPQQINYRKLVTYFFA